MPSTLSSIAAKDGAAATVTGGILAVDKSGAGTGPFFAAQTIVDTQGVNTATVKAASTAAVATDTSVVVALNPNTIPAVTLTGATNNINNIAGTVSLPTGAATSAKQPALGTAGAPATDVISVQGISSGTPMLVNQAGVWSTRALGNAGAVMDFPGQNSAAAANALQVGGQFNTTPTTITSGSSSPLQLDSAGNLLVNVKTGGAGGGVVTQSTASNLKTAISDGTGNALTSTGGALDINVKSGVAAVGQTTMSASSPVVLASDHTAIRMSQDTSTLLNGNTALTPVSVGITASSSGAQQLVALVSSKKIRVLAMALTVNGAVNPKLQSHTTTATATGLFYCAAAGDGIVLPYNPLGWFDTVAGEALDINLSGAVAVGGTLTYVAV